jgi:hypothetical protein
MTDKTSTDTQNYSIIFRGDIVMGYSLPDVKQNLQKLFSVDDAETNRLFMGKPVALRRGLQLDEANRYKEILKQEGVIVSVQADNEIKAASKPQSKEQPKTKSSPASDSGSEKIDETKQDWQLLPVGSQLSDSKTETNIVEIKTDHLKVLPQEGNLLKDDERQAARVAVIDVTNLNWELSPYGEQLLKASERKSVAASNVDTSSLSLTKQEGNLLKDSEKNVVPEVDIDISHIKLVPDDQ